MLTTEDIQNIIKVQEKVFATKQDLNKGFEGMRTSFSDLQTSVDAYAKKADTYFQEMLMLAHKVRRLERWIQQLAKKVEVTLDPFED